VTLSPLTAAATAAGVVAAAAVLAFSHTPSLFVWASFIGWASYDHSGVNLQGLLRSSAALVFGVVMAWCVAAAVSAAIASFAIVLASATPLLSVVPATFYGFASTFAYVSLAPGASSIEALTRPDAQNVLVTLPVSLLIGSVLGVAHGWLAKRLSGAQLNVTTRQIHARSDA
jgi:hypothetical protein